MSRACASVRTERSISLRFFTTGRASTSSRSCRVSDRDGIGLSQISASSPIWWLAWPLSIGPPLGCDMSPTSSPGQPSFSLASLASLHQLDQGGMGPIAVPRQPHHLPCRAVHRERLGPRQAAMRVESDRPCRERRRFLDISEQFLGGHCFGGRSPFCRSALSSAPAKAGIVHKTAMTTAVRRMILGTRFLITCIEQVLPSTVQAIILGLGFRIA